VDLTAASTGPRPRPFGQQLERFANAVGSSGAVAVVGGQTAWDLGGPLGRGVRLVQAPAGVVELDAAEMVVRVGAGTPTSDLQDALAEHGQEVALPVRPGGTVGGALVVGWSDVRRLGRGPIRDTVLEASVVTASGRLVRAGGPTVKNVTGYDLCRLLVGSLGTLALLGEVVLRTRPRPPSAQWFQAPATAPDLGTLRVPSSVTACLWDGTSAWVLLEGHPDDIDRHRSVLGLGGLIPVPEPPSLPPNRWSVEPAHLTAALRRQTDPYVAEVGVGTVHSAAPAPARPVPAVVRSLNQRMKQTFDPSDRLNPGRDVLAR
jgi:hypothetical protein